MNYKDYIDSEINEKFEYFMKTRFSTNRTSNYWINWDNVNHNTDEIHEKLKKLDYLVGKKDIKNIAKKYFKENPELLTTIPVLLAIRDKSIDELNISKDGSMSIENFNFKKIDVHKIDKYINFMNDAGILNMFEHLNGSVYDYVYGVQVGLDTNGRKNRGGTQNEKILKNSMLKVTNNNNKEYLEQATADKIYKKWGIEIPEPLDKKAKGGRRYDGAIFNPDTKTVTIIETNFYNGGGSKLKAVAGEFSDMYETSLKNASNVNFVWISDGKGWDSAKNPMREAFHIIPNIINLKMVEKGFLDEITDISSK